MVGAVVGVVVCGGAAAVIVGKSRSGGSGDGVISHGMSVESSAVPTRTERPVVPDACLLLNDAVAGNLVPQADRNQADTFTATDAHNQCVWSRFGDRQRRQLTVELRAVAAANGRSATDVASDTLARERRADESGQGLAPGQRLTAKRTVRDVGDAAYATYSEGLGRGEAIVNVRTVNILVTVHYAGGDGAATPLSPARAINGAIKAAKETVGALGGG